MTLGIERYGTILNTFEVPFSATDNYMRVTRAQVLQPEATARLAVWRDVQQLDDPYLEFSLPRDFKSLDQLKSRTPLKVEWLNSSHTSTTKEALADLLEGYDCWVRITNPKLQSVTAIKLYQEYKSGENIDSHHIVVPTSDMFTSITDYISLLRDITGKNWTGGFTNLVYTGSFELDQMEIHNPHKLPYTNGLSKPKIIPMFDFDLQFTADPQKELTQVCNTLQTNGFSGWIAKSGRGYHYIGDFLLPYNNLHNSLGLLTRLTLSTDPEFKLHRDFAQRIYSAPGIREARKIADEILSPEGIPNADTPSVGDIRYVANCLKRGFCVLRAAPYWKHPDNYPQVVARIS